jgi:hypothetical protein
MTPSEPPTDPGWGGPVGILLMFVPIIGHRRMRGADPLLVLRRVFLSFCVAIVLFLWVLGFLDLGGSGNVALSGTAAATLAAIFGVVCLASSRRFVNRPLDCASGQSLSSSYRERFFLRLAFGEAPALVGFVLVFLARTRWPYVIGASFTAIGFAWAAPTKRHLAQDQRRLSSSGCARDLVAALRGLDT